MAKILIVDDEKFSVEFLLSGIDFKALGISEVFTANDARKAVEIASLNKIDILMSDIRMPTTDGITLASEIRAVLPNCKVIFMSGFSEKEYYKSAIKLNAVAFIEKPFDIDEIKEALKKAAKDININMSDTIHHDISTILRKNLALELTREITDYDAFIKKFSLCNMHIIENSYIITGLIKFIDKNTDKNDYSQIIAHTEKKLSEFSPKEKKIDIIYSFKQDNILLFYLFSEKEAFFSKRNLTEIYKLLTENLKEQYNFIASFGQPVYGLNNAYKSYRNAVINLEAGFITGYNNPVFYIIKNEPYDFDSDTTRNIIQAIKHRDKSTVLDLLNLVLHSLSLHPCTPSIKIKTHYIYLLGKLNDEINIHINTSAQKKLDLSQQSMLINNCNTLMEIQAILYDYIDNIFAIYTNTYSPAIQKVLAYIHENYNKNDLTLTAISDYISFNTSYMCTLFKKETGKTVNSYITEYRINKAKDLLVNTNNIIEAISKEIGYSDIKHFFKTFKKHTGMSPSKYRNVFTI